MGRVSGIALYFDDRAENAEAGKRFGFQSVLVKTNHLEEHLEWLEINKDIRTSESVEFRYIDNQT